jgi:hypothetical protein
MKCKKLENTHHNLFAILLCALLLEVPSKYHLEVAALLISKLLPSKLQSASDYDLCCVTTAAATVTSPGNDIHNKLAVNQSQENKGLYDENIWWSFLL